MTINALGLSHEFADLIREDTPKSRFMGTKVSGLKTAGFKHELGTFGVTIAYVSRGSLTSDEIDL
jgi:hypothetical protein